MSPEDCKRSREQRPPSLQHIQDQIRSACEDLIHCCSQEIDMTFYQTEQSLQGKISLPDTFLRLNCNIHYRTLF